MNRQNVLLLMAKAPKLGEVKTRLQPELSAQQAMSLYEAMGLDLVSRFRDSKIFDFKVFYCPAGSKQEMRSWLGEGVDLVPQQGRDLGQRMYSAFEWAFGRGYRKAAIIGCDAPDLECSLLLDAFAKRDDSDVALGPSTDGGYYLIGLKEPCADLFEGIGWGTDRVLEQTKRKIETAGLSVYLLPRKDDIDTYPDVLGLWDRLKSGELTTNIPNTFKALKKITDLV